MKKDKEISEVDNSWEDLDAIIEEQVANYCGLFDQATFKAEIKDFIQETISQVKKEEREYISNDKCAVCGHGILNESNIRHGEREKIIEYIEDIKWDGRLSQGQMLDNIINYLNQ